MDAEIAMGADPVNNEIWPVHVEVRLTQRSSTPFETIRRLVHTYISDNYAIITMPEIITGWEICSTLQNNVEQIAVSDSVCPITCLRIEQCILQVHIYQLSENSTYESLAANPSDPSEEFTAGTMTDLPCKEIEGLWDSLFYEENVKSRLLDYIYATIGFSDAGVDYNLVSWNRVILLHGPPGTGKTSLCKALAQKLSIRLKDRYNKTYLFEINSHSLFSRWFSESGKLVQKLFSTVSEMAKEEEDFVVLLIDEVESLTSARAGAMSGTEPSDALRVVNALLTQIDQLKHQKNVLIMATSNLAKAIDAAFVDRADIAEYIGYPPTEAIYEILRSSVVELMQKGIISESSVPNARSAKLYYDTEVPSDANVLQGFASQINSMNSTEQRDLPRMIGSGLYALAGKCKGMSGRALRRLPVLAHARYIGFIPTAKNKPGTVGQGKDASSKDGANASSVPIEAWLRAMQKVVADESLSRAKFTDQ